MEKHIENIIEKHNKSRRQKVILGIIIGIISCIVCISTIYFFAQYAQTKTGVSTYELKLIDNDYLTAKGVSTTEELEKARNILKEKETAGILDTYIAGLQEKVTLETITAEEQNTLNVYEKSNWKDDYVETYTDTSGNTIEKSKTWYNLDLLFVDADGNPIEGNDITLSIDNSNDKPVGFGNIPVSETSTVGYDLIDKINLTTYEASTGKIYEFDHAEVYVKGAWYRFLDTSNHWDLYLDGFSSVTDTGEYGWKGYYGENTQYQVDTNTQFKFVYNKKVQTKLKATSNAKSGADTAVDSLGAESGITFKLFNYQGTNAEEGINANGAYNYFTFHNTAIRNPAAKIIYETDEPAYGKNHATVLPNLDSNGYPVFDSRTGNASDNFSLGYLFGASTNAKGTATVGVTAYNPENTLLQKQTINGIDSYYYDSKINAVDYDTTNNKFIVRNYTERNSTLAGFAKESDRYDFLPFTYRTTTDLKTHPTTRFTYNYENSDVDFWFGMTMDANFYMPKNGKLENEDMIFSFSGDDDVYVFIDNVLVLDIGGSHWPVDGTINFSTGEVESYFNWDGTDGRTDGTGRYVKTTIYDMFVEAGKTNSVVWNDAKTTFADYTNHTIKFFYLERGACVSNCKIRFNMPILPPGELSVKKEVTGLTSDISETYGFKLYNVTSGTAVPASNIPYTINNTTYYTDANGAFSLNADDIAKFQLVTTNKYYVEEINSGQNFEPYSCLLNGVTCKNKNTTDQITISDTTAQIVVFTNIRKAFDITITKDVFDEDKEAEFDFTFILKDNLENQVVPMYTPTSTDGYTLNTTTGEISFNLKDDESVTIKGIPKNVTATLKEVKHDGYNVLIKEGNMVLSDYDTYTFAIKDNESIVVHNIPDIELPETGSSGELIMLLAGIVLMITPFVYKYIYCKSKKGYKDNS